MLHTFVRDYFIENNFIRNVFFFKLMYKFRYQQRQEAAMPTALREVLAQFLDHSAEPVLQVTLYRIVKFDQKRKDQLSSEFSYKFYR